MSEPYPGSPVADLAEGASRLAAGELGLVVARPGTGKTTLLVHLALASLLRGRGALHVALVDTVDHARAHYDEVVRALGGQLRAEDAAVRIERHRMIHSFHGRPFEVAALGRNLAMLEEVAQFRPELVVVDGFARWAELEPRLPELRTLAAERGLVLWASVRAEDTPPEPIAAAARRILRLEPAAHGVRLAAEPAAEGDAPIDLPLDPGTLLVRGSDPATGAARPLRPSQCTLFSGGALGAEIAFGEAAERHGVEEVNFTFDGHLQARSKGRHVLSAKDLAMGDVSLTYVSRRLNRSYKNEAGGLLRGVLQTLWHMVSRAQQVFVIGTIQPDGTVVGGTGWSVELARTWQRELWVFDQPRRAWFRWDGAAWAEGTPTLTSPQFCGTGTRYLDEHGRAAIDQLFARSFGG